MCICVIFQMSFHHMCFVPSETQNSLNKMSGFTYANMPTVTLKLLDVKHYLLMKPLNSLITRVQEGDSTV